jgi:hypothetical protein
MCFKLLGALATLSLGLGVCQDLGSLHIFNGDIALGKNGLLQLHTRVRTHQQLQQFFQFRGGPIYYHNYRPWLQAIGGYYHIDEDKPDGKIHGFHRYFGGGQFLTPTGKAARFEARTLLERFENTRRGDPHSDFWRVRERFWLTLGRRSIRPYGQAEFLRQHGELLTRAGSGVLWRTQARDVFLGYEFRQLPGGSHLHLLTSNMTMRLRQRQ